MLPKATHFALSLVGLAMLGACASNYVAPAEGPRALVTMRATSVPRGTFVSSFASRQCDGRQSLGLLSQDNHQEVSTQFRAGQDVVLTFKYSAVTAYNQERVCQATVAFVPQDGAHYDVRYDTDTTALRCRAMVMVERSSGRWELLPEASANVRACTWS